MSRVPDASDTLELLPAIDFSEGPGIKKDSLQMNKLEVPALCDGTAIKVGEVVRNHQSSIAQPLFGGGERTSAFDGIDFELVPASLDHLDGTLSTVNSSLPDGDEKINFRAGANFNKIQLHFPGDVPERAINPLLDSHIKKSLPGDIWEILKPLVMDSEKRNDPCSIEIVSFFFGPEAPKIDSDEFLKYDAQLDLESALENEMDDSLDNLAKRIARYESILIFFQVKKLTKTYENLQNQLTLKLVEQNALWERKKKECVSHTGENLPPDIWNIVSPVAEELIKEDNVYFAKIVSFFFGPTAPKIYEAGFMNYHALDDNDSFVTEEREYEKLIRFGCILRYFLQELGISETDSTNPQKDIGFIEEYYIQLDIPNISLAKYQHIVADHREFSEGREYPGFSDEVRGVLKKMVLHIAKRSKVLCKSTWDTIDRIKAEELAREKAILEKENKGKIAEIEDSPLEKEEKDIQMQLVQQETEQRNIKLLQEQEKAAKNRREIHAKIEKAWRETELVFTNQIIQMLNATNPDYKAIDDLWDEISWDMLDEARQDELRSCRRKSNRRRRGIL